MSRIPDAPQVALYRLTASAVFINMPNGHLLRHAILARQHPAAWTLEQGPTGSGCSWVKERLFAKEVFGPFPDLRQARRMHSEGFLWGSVWEQAGQAGVSEESKK